MLPSTEVSCLSIGQLLQEQYDQLITARYAERQGIDSSCCEIQQGILTGPLTACTGPRKRKVSNCWTEACYNNHASLASRSGSRNPRQKRLETRDRLALTASVPDVTEDNQSTPRSIAHDLQDGDGSIHLEPSSVQETGNSSVDGLRSNDVSTLSGSSPRPEVEQDDTPINGLEADHGSTQGTIKPVKAGSNGRAQIDQVLAHRLASDLVQRISKGLTILAQPDGRPQFAKEQHVPYPQTQSQDLPPECHITNLLDQAEFTRTNARRESWWLRFVAGAIWILILSGTRREGMLSENQKKTVGEWALVVTLVHDIVKRLEPRWGHMAYFVCDALAGTLPSSSNHECRI